MYSINTIFVYSSVIAFHGRGKEWCNNEEKKLVALAKTKKIARLSVNKCNGVAFSPWGYVTTSQLVRNPLQGSRDYVTES